MITRLQMWFSFRLDFKGINKKTQLWIHLFFSLCLVNIVATHCCLHVEIFYRKATKSL